MDVYKMQSALTSLFLDEEPLNSADCDYMFKRGYVDSAMQVTLEGRQFLGRMNYRRCIVPNCNKQYQRVPLCSGHRHHYYENGLRGEELALSYQPVSKELVPILIEVMAAPQHLGYPIVRCSNHKIQLIFEALSQGFLRFVDEETTNAVVITGKAFNLQQLGFERG